ncbi:MAG: BamA/TamA family outer membrane protein [bacterium]|nr:BamA/TamA family outer membrane protein [bacterium]
MGGGPTPAAVGIRARKQVLSLVTVLVVILLPQGAPAQTGGTDDSAPSGPIIEHLRFDGLTLFEESEIAEQIVTSERAALDPRFWRPAPRLDPFTLEDDLDRIRDLYRSVGHFEAEIQADVVPLAPSRSAERVDVHLTIVEGPATRLDGWDLTIVEPADAARPLSDAERTALQAIVEPRDEGRFGTRLYRERREALLLACAEMGFLFARIEGRASVSTETLSARVDWQLRIGRRATVGAISFTGLERVSRHVVARELRLERGEVLRASMLRDSERRLIETALFRSVVVGEPKGGDGARVDGVVDLEIFLEEAPPRSARASIGYGREDGPRAEVSLDWRNFLGDARRLRLRAFGSFLDVGFEGTLGQPHFFGPKTRVDLSVSALRRARPGYEAFVTGASGIVSHALRRDGPVTVFGGLGYELSDILSFEISTSPAVRGPEDSVIVNGFGGIRYDGVDDRLDPRHGFRATLEAELGGFPLGSDLDYHQWSLDLRAYRALGPVVLAARAAATTLDPIDGSRDDVPLTRRLYSGGTQSIRGFGFQKLGPEDAANDPIGGLSRMELGTELRLRVYGPFALVGFVEAGDVRSRPFAFHPSALRAAAGPGLRVDTPVGPLRLDVGFLLNPPRDTDPWRIHLSVGHAF